MEFTLDRAEKAGIYNGPLDLKFPEHVRSWTDWDTEMGGKYGERAKYVAAHTNENMDIFPPGWREQMADPSRPNLGPYPTTQWTRYHDFGNNNPTLNTDGGVPSWMTSEWGQKRATEMYRICRDTLDDEHWINRDFGQFTVPYTGQTALKDFKPQSTRGWMF